MSDPGTVTRLLGEWRGGRNDALDELIPLVHAELQRIAKGRMAKEGRLRVLLQTADLIQEAYVRLVPVKHPPANRRHFFALAATVMRHVLVDHARRLGRQKRGDETPLTSDEIADVRSALCVEQLLDLAVVMERFRAEDPKRAEVFDLYFYFGFSQPKIAKLLQRSTATVNRQLNLGKARVRIELEEGRNES
jgi:RNA polymerase sigma-70 factor, ECF subfamily